MNYCLLISLWIIKHDIYLNKIQGQNLIKPIFDKTLFKVVKYCVHDFKRRVKIIYQFISSFYLYHY